MTDEGFISAVRFNASKDKQPRSRREVKSWGKRPMLLRARRAEDLEQVRPYYRKLRVEAVNAADYKYRAIVPNARWVDFLASKGNEITYDSHFKEAARARQNGTRGDNYYSALMKVWGIMMSLQSASKPWTSYGAAGSSTTNYSSGGYGTGKANSSSYSSAPPALSGAGSGNPLGSRVPSPPLDTVEDMVPYLLSIPVDEITVDEYTSPAAKMLHEYVKTTMFSGPLTKDDIIWCLDNLLEVINSGDLGATSLKPKDFNEINDALLALEDDSTLADSR